MRGTESTDKLKILQLLHTLTVICMLSSLYLSVLSFTRENYYKVICHGTKVVSYISLLRVVCTTRTIISIDYLYRVADISM